MNLSECKPLVERYTKRNPGWWTPRVSESVDSHSGVPIKYKTRQQKWSKTKPGEKGFACVDGSIIEVYVHSKLRRDDQFFLVVMPGLLDDARHQVDIDHYSKSKWRLAEKMKGD